MVVESLARSARRVRLAGYLRWQKVGYRAS